MWRLLSKRKKAATFQDVEARELQPNHDPKPVQGCLMVFGAGSPKFNGLYVAYTSSRAEAKIVYRKTSGPESLVFYNNWWIFKIGHTAGSHYGAPAVSSHAPPEQGWKVKHGSWPAPHVQILDSMDDVPDWLRKPESPQPCGLLVHDAGSPGVDGLYQVCGLRNRRVQYRQLDGPHVIAHSEGRWWLSEEGGGAAYSCTCTGALLASDLAWTVHAGLEPAPCVQRCSSPSLRPGDACEDTLRGALEPPATKSGRRVGQTEATKPSHGHRKQRNASPEQQSAARDQSQCELSQKWPFVQEQDEQEDPEYPLFRDGLAERSTQDKTSRRTEGGAISNAEKTHRADAVLGVWAYASESEYTIAWEGTRLMFREASLTGHLEFTSGWFVATLIEYEAIRGELRLRRTADHLESQIRPLGDMHFGETTVAWPLQGHKPAAQDPGPSDAQEATTGPSEKNHDSSRGFARDREATYEKAQAEQLGTDEAIPVNKASSTGSVNFTEDVHLQGHPSVAPCSAGLDREVEEALVKLVNAVEAFSHRVVQKDIDELEDLGREASTECSSCGSCSTGPEGPEIAQAESLDVEEAVIALSQAPGKPASLPEPGFVTSRVLSFNRRSAEAYNQRAAASKQAWR